MGLKAAYYRRFVKPSIDKKEERMVASLKNFYVGFTALERQLYKMPHTGYVHYDKDRLVLSKSAFRRTPINERCFYAVPKDLRPMEHELVTLEVEGPIHEIKGRIKDTCFINRRDWFRVVGVTRPSPNEIAFIEPPHLDRDAFLHRICPWANAAEDFLDYSTAWQVLSCSEGPWGRGGIGSWSLAEHHSPEPLRNFKKTITRLLPEEFIQGTSRYRYSFIETKKSHMEVERDRIKSNISEISYNHLGQIPDRSPITSIQIPTFIYNAKYIPGRLEVDQDVLEYLLTALSIDPVINDPMVTKIENTARRVYERIKRDEEFARVNIDPLSPAKIANTICRFHLKPKMDEESFDHYTNKLDEMIYAFMDKVQENISNNPDNKTWTDSNVAVSYQKIQMESIDYIVLYIMRKTEEEQGTIWITQPEIEEYSEFKPEWRGRGLSDSLERLNNMGKIIKSPRGLGYRRFKFI